LLIEKIWQIFYHLKYQTYIDTASWF